MILINKFRHISFSKEKAFKFFMLRQKLSITESKYLLLRKVIKNLYKSRKGKVSIIFFILFVWFWFSLPSKLFNNPTSTVMVDKDGVLLCAKISADKQWRFPQIEKVPDKFVKAITQYEDRHFFYHIGFNPVSMFKALITDIKRGKIVRGGSTISMQVIRLSRKGKKRTIFEKIIEVILAFRLELSYSKSEIIAMYASNAPFGSNVVGIEAASWRYFGRAPEKLSWSEMATLAVLPNSPSLIYPGKNQEKLRLKRNRLLRRLNTEKYLDNNELESAKCEQLPNKPFPLPLLTPHLLERSINL